MRTEEGETMPPDSCERDTRRAKAASLADFLQAASYGCELVIGCRARSAPAANQRP